MQEITTIPEKEVTEYKNQTSFIKQSADSLTITTTEDMSKGQDILSDLLKVEKTIKERKEMITKPLMAGLASAREMFKPMETVCTDAKKLVKQKMLDYTVGEEERVAKEEARVEARLEKGTIRQDTAIRKMEDIKEAPKTSLRVVTKVRIVDEALIPREYLIPNVPKITEALLRQKVEVSGCETYEEKSIVGRTR